MKNIELRKEKLHKQAPNSARIEANQIQQNNQISRNRILGIEAEDLAEELVLEFADLREGILGIGNNFVGETF